MTREEFINKIKDIFCSDEPNEQYRFVCFDEFYTRIGFYPVNENQYTDYILNYRLLHRIGVITNNKNIKVYHSRPENGSEYYELVIDGFTIDK